MISYGSQQRSAEMPCDNRSHQLGEGQPRNTGMSVVVHPPLLVLESQGSNAEMPMRDRSQGKGQRRLTAMSRGLHPSRLVYGSRNHNAEMPMEKRSHLFTRGRTSLAEMPRIARLSREGSANQRRNVRRGPPFPTSLRKRSWVVRSNAIPDSSFLRGGSIQHCNNARIDTLFPTSFGLHSRRSNAN